MPSTRNIGLLALATAATIFELVTASSLHDGEISTASKLISPDRIGEVPIRGFRLDKPYGSDDNATPIKGWTLQVNMTEQASRVADPNDYGTRIWPPQPPSDGALWDAHTGEWLGSEDVSNTWGVLALHFDRQQLPETAEGNDMEDGSCPDSVFSEQCRMDYVATILEHIDDESPERFVVPKSCTGFTGSNLIIPIIPSTRVNFTVGAYSTYSNYADGQSWIEMKDKTWPFILIWGPARGSSHELTADRIQFNCVKADTDGKTGQPLSADASNNGTATATTTSFSASSSSTSSTPADANTPMPTAGASLHSAVSKSLGAVAALIVAVGVGLL